MHLPKKTLLLLILTLSSHAEIKESEVRKLTNQIIQENISNCMNVTNKYDKVYCSGKIYNILDDKLNHSYKTLRKKLSTSQKNRLKVVQRKWIQQRDDSCATINNSGVTINLTCSIKGTSASLYYIKEMLNHPQDVDTLLKEYEQEL